MNEKYSYAKVVDMIRVLVARMQTATLYIRTDHNRMVLVAMKDGEIITLSSGPRHGAKAISILREMRSAAVRIDNNAIAYHTENMPPTTVLLSMLETGTQQAPAVSGKRPSASGSSGMEKERVKIILSQLLTEYLGPIAPMCCEQVLDAMGNSLDVDQQRAAVQQLATEAGSPEEARAFTERARQQLNLR